VEWTAHNQRKIRVAHFRSALGICRALAHRGVSVSEMVPRWHDAMPLRQLDLSTQLVLFPSLSDRRRVRGKFNIALRWEIV